MYLTTNLILIYYHFTRVRSITLILSAWCTSTFPYASQNRDYAHHTSSSQDEDTTGDYSDQRRVGNLDGQSYSLRGNQHRAAFRHLERLCVLGPDTWSNRPLLISVCDVRAGAFAHTSSISLRLVIIIVIYVTTNGKRMYAIVWMNMIVFRYKLNSKLILIVSCHFRTVSPNFNKTFIFYKRLDLYPSGDWSRLSPVRKQVY